VNNNFATGTAEDLPKTFVQIKFLGGKIKTRSLRFPWISFLLKIDRLHENLRMIAVGRI
jgi:hypothetical protein